MSKDIRREEKVFEIITATVQKIGEIYEKVLAMHEKQYGKAVIYSDLHTVLPTNLARLQEIMGN